MFSWKKEHVAGEIRLDSLIMASVRLSLVIGSEEREIPPGALHFYST